MKITVTVCLVGGLMMDLKTQHCLLKSIEKEQPKSNCSIKTQLKDNHFPPHLESFFWSVSLLSNHELVGILSLQLTEDYISYEIVIRLFNQQIKDHIIIEILKEVIEYSFNELKIMCLKTKISGLNIEMTEIISVVGMKLEEKVVENGEVVSIYSIKNSPTLMSSKMRKSSTVLSQILHFVKYEEPIRILVQAGLRLDRHAPIDLMRDYHFNFFVIDKYVSFYQQNQEWIELFGETVLTRFSYLDDKTYVFQIQYQDGVRIDFQFIPLSGYDKTIASDSLVKLLLDKEGLMTQLDEPNDRSHYIEKPTFEEFNDLLHHIGWYQIDVAKAMYRDELPLAKGGYDAELMPAIIKLLSWYIGIRYDWSVDIGRGGRWLKRYLSENLYSEFIYFYSTKGYVSMWERLFEMGPFIQKIAKDISRSLNFSYSEQEFKGVMEFLHRINSLPNNATDFNS